MPASGQMHKFDPRAAKRDFGLDENRGEGGVFGNPHPQPCVRQFLAMIKYPNGDTENGKVPGGYAGCSLWGVDAGNNVIQTPSIENGDTQLRRKLPIRGTQVI